MLYPTYGSSGRKPNPHDRRFESLQPQPAPGSMLKTVGLCALGWVTGYLISLVSSIIFFLAGRIAPQ